MTESSARPSGALSGLTLTGLGSMATRQLLAELAAQFQRTSGHTVQLQAVGGVDAARRVQAGEHFDVVFLAADALEKLLAAGHLQAGSRVDLVKSPVAVAVKSGASCPDISSAEALKAAMRAAARISFSTGPSGTHLTQLLQSWGLAEELKPRLVQAPVGVPVGTLVARGEVDLGFQQLSELMHLEGVQVLGLLPAEAAFVTTFSAALGLGVQPGSPRHEAVLALLAHLNSPAAAATKRQHGMEPINQD